MRGLRLRPMALVAVLALVATPGLAYDPSTSRIPSLEDAQNLMEYGSIVHDPLSRYIKSIDPDWKEKASVDMHVTLPDNVRIPGPLGAPAGDRTTEAGSKLPVDESARFGSGVPLASSGGAIATRPVDRSVMRSTLQDVNDALGL